MEANETSRDASAAPRDPASISPSAYALLMMKSHTSIPYVREAAALAAQADLAAQATPTASHTPDTPAATATAHAPLLSPPDHSAPPDSGARLASGIDIDPFDYWTRVMHFESRYWSINQLLEDLTATNILEISSGFSFRGLELSYKKPVFYIDTDLPNIIAGKQRFIDTLTAPGSPAPANSTLSPGSPAPAGAPAPARPPAAAPPHPRAPNPPAPAAPGSSPATPTPPGHYELQPLNALDPIAFEAVVNRFPPGPLTIINEGLLVYLDPAEKAQLCANIRKALLARGGKWITADIYIKRAEDDTGMRSNAWREWSREHGLEEKKFASFHEAETFFHSMGFEKEKEATQDYSRLTSFALFLKTIGPEGLNELRRPGRPRLHATWRLTPKDAANYDDL